jgi:hypothetical protein
MAISKNTPRPALAIAATGAFAMLIATMPAEAAPWGAPSAAAGLSAGSLPVEHVSWRGRRNGVLIAGAVGLGFLGIAAAVAASQPRYGYAPGYGYAPPPSYGYGYDYGYAPVQTYAPAYVQAPAYGYGPVYAKPSYGNGPVYQAPRHVPVYGYRGDPKGRMRGGQGSFQTQTGDIFPMRGNNGGG